MDRARDELFSHIQRCGVLEAEADQRKEWMVDTIDYISERYPSLSKEELGQLKEIGNRYCAPAIPHGNGTGEDADEEAEEERTAESTTAEAPEPQAADETKEVEPVTTIEDVEDVEPVSEAAEETASDEDEESGTELEEEERDEVGVA